MRLCFVKITDGGIREAVAASPITSKGARFGERQLSELLRESDISSAQLREAMGTISDYRLSDASPQRRIFYRTT